MIHADGMGYGDLLNEIDTMVGPAVERCLNGYLSKVGAESARCEVVRFVGGLVVRPTPTVVMDEVAAIRTGANVIARWRAGG